MFWKGGGGGGLVECVRNQTKTRLSIHITDITTISIVIIALLLLNWEWYNCWVFRYNFTTPPHHPPTTPPPAVYHEALLWIFFLLFNLVWYYVWVENKETRSRNCKWEIGDGFFQMNQCWVGMCVQYFECWEFLSSQNLYNLPS